MKLIFIRERILKKRGVRNAGFDDWSWAWRDSSS
jgi:hypothetical protein